MSSIDPHHVKPQLLELYRRLLNHELHPEEAHEQRKGNRVRYTFTFEETSNEQKSNNSESTQES